MRIPYLLRLHLFCLLLFLITIPALGDVHWVPFGKEGVTFAKSQQAWQEMGSERALPLKANARIDQAVAAAGSWWVAAVEAVDGEERMVLLKGNAESIEQLPTPIVEQSTVLLQPQLLINEAGVDSAIWIEGSTHRTTRVRFARWSGSGWAQPVTLSAKGPGSQIALQSARLNDGSYLAVWSAFDGTDDEIMWSRCQEAAWSAPSAISANEVPDVTPALRATDDGALLVWSAYDGNDYRLYSAAFEGSSWTKGRQLGDRGAILPTFAQTEAPVIVFQQGSPRVWAFSELSSQAEVLRSTKTQYQRQRPVLKAHDQRGVELMWVRSGPEKASTSSQQVPWSMSVD